MCHPDNRGFIRLYANDAGSLCTEVSHKFIFCTEQVQGPSELLRYDRSFASDFSVTYVNIQKVLTITDGGIDSNHNLINLGLDNLGGGKLSAYAYLLDYDAATIADSATYGVRYKG